MHERKSLVAEVSFAKKLLRSQPCSSVCFKGFLFNIDVNKSIFVPVWLPVSASNNKVVHRVHPLSSIIIHTFTYRWRILLFFLFNMNKNDSSNNIWIKIWWLLWLPDHCQQIWSNHTQTVLMKQWLKQLIILHKPKKKSSDFYPVWLKVSSWVHLWLCGECGVLHLWRKNDRCSKVRRKPLDDFLVLMCLLFSEILEAQKIS